MKQNFWNIILKIILPAVLAVLFFVLILFGYILPQTRDLLFEKKREMTRELVNAIHSIIEGLHEKSERGEITQDKAQTLAQEYIRSIHYGPYNNDYVWINDIKGFMLVHPSEELDRKNVFSLVEPITNGKFIVQEFIDIIKKQDEGYSSYIWRSKDNPNEFALKTSFIKNFKPWNWIIGTGLYVEDERAEIALITRRVTLLSLGILTLITLLMLYNVKSGVHSEKKRTLAENDLKESYKNLKKLDKVKDSFLSVASHELRTPMTIIKGYSDFLLSGKFGKLNKQQKDFQQRISRNTENLLTLVGDILDLSKLEAGRLDFSFSEINLKTTLQEILADFKIICKEKNIKLTLDLKAKNSFQTDIEKFKRILDNLLGNAVKFTPVNGNISVYVRNQDDNFLRLEVRDTGIGIPKNQQKLIFEKFCQVDGYLQKKYTGTGLGLSIVKKIIELLNGKIWVESIIGKGSNFIFLMPLKPLKDGTKN
jgi:signal transduction histidine kinase